MRIDPLSQTYPLRVREVTLGVMLFISLLFYGFPKFLGESKKMSTTVKEEIETFDIPQTEQLKIPEPPPRPSVPVASEDEFFDEDITIEDTEIEDFEDWEGPGFGPDPSDEFIPYDQAPVPKIPIGSLIVYPELAREAGIEGKVYIKAFINVKGIVTSVQVLKGIPNTGLDEAAIKAVRKSRWHPARQRDKKVGVWITIPIDFSLSN
ncbi:MAG: energy transducer TonB [Candidatus Marinimicrobia bacterium]|jgi:protein TonB|nr:energy transducer TonB [Candidatus Neomarinimicrobiota bacterium]|tara:strand:- start:339 stop:959 length:621 start_codon:yes stop_codon:yes gene_type:complete